MCTTRYTARTHVSADACVLGACVRAWPDPLPLRVPGSSVRPRPRPPACRPQIGPRRLPPAAVAAFTRLRCSAPRRPRPAAGAPAAAARDPHIPLAGSLRAGAAAVTPSRPEERGRVQIRVSRSAPQARPHGAGAGRAAGVAEPWRLGAGAAAGVERPRHAGRARPRHVAAHPLLGSAAAVNTRREIRIRARESADPRLGIAPPTADTPRTSAALPHSPASRPPLGRHLPPPPPPRRRHPFYAGRECP